MVKKYFTIQDTTWFCISFFYSRKDWGKILKEIFSYYKQNESLFKCCMVYLSDDRGEHIRLELSLSTDNDLDLIQKETDKHFRSFIASNPSCEAKSFDYGEKIWCNYANNSIEWNRFKFNHSANNSYFDFSQSTSYLMIDFLEDDYSLDNAFSTAIFLSVKMLKKYSVISDNNIENTLNKLADNTSFKSLATDYNLKEELDLLGVGFEEMMALIEQYWNYEVKDNPLFTMGR